MRCVVNWGDPTIITNLKIAPKLLIVRSTVAIAAGQVLVFRNLAVFTLLYIFATGTAAADKTLSLATLDWEPYVGHNIPNGGFISEIVTAAFKRAGYTVKVSFVPWARVLKDVKKGAYDAGYPAYYTDDRTAIYAFSRPLANSTLGFLKRKDKNISYHSLSDLKGYAIAVVRGYVNTPDFDAAEYLNKQIADSDLQNIRKLSKERVDLVVVDKFTAQALISKHFPGPPAIFDFMDPPLQIKPLFVLFSRNVPGYEERLKEFNTALAQINADGTVAEILKRHGFQDQ
jgi:ABC-type amino acid transport substrate-binding protein